MIRAEEVIGLEHLIHGIERARDFASRKKAVTDIVVTEWHLLQNELNASQNEAQRDHIAQHVASLSKEISETARTSALHRGLFVSWLNGSSHLYEDELTDSISATVNSLEDASSSATLMSGYSRCSSSSYSRYAAHRRSLDQFGLLDTKPNPTSFHREESRSLSSCCSTHNIPCSARDSHFCSHSRNDDAVSATESKNCVRERQQRRANVSLDIQMYKQMRQVDICHC